MKKTKKIIIAIDGVSKVNIIRLIEFEKQESIKKDIQRLRK
jgi:hypothetical protein